MSTRSTIAIRLKKEDIGKTFTNDYDETLVASKPFLEIYCHYDGYVEDGVGEELYRHFNSYEEALALVLNGNHSRITPDVSTYLDKGEDWEDNQPMQLDDVKLSEDYAYLFADGRWYVDCGNSGYDSDSSRYEVLEHVLAAEDFAGKYDDYRAEAAALRTSKMVVKYLIKDLNPSDAKSRKLLKTFAEIDEEDTFCGKGGQAEEYMNIAIQEFRKEFHNWSESAIEYALELGATIPEFISYALRTRARRILDDADISYKE